MAVTQHGNHPKMATGLYGRPLIDYQVAAMLIPPMLLGVTTGVYLNRMCPNWLIMVLVVGLCSVSGARTLSQARAK